MKNLILVFVILGFTSCGSKTGVDKRTAEQMSFVNYIKDIRDKVNAAGEDKALRGSILDRGVEDVKVYVKDSLGLKFTKWQVKVIDKKQNLRNPALTDIKLLMIMDQGNQSAEKSIILNGSAADEQISNVLKELNPGDQIIISGNFIEKNGFIDIDSYSRYKFSKNVFDNPEFKTIFTAAEKH